MRLAYADPPYPGCAHLYPEKTEVDHASLLVKLETSYSGWALSTNENALQYLFSLPVLRTARPGIRVLSWCKTNAPPFFPNPIPSWEPVICRPARTTRQGVRSFFVSEAPTGHRRHGEIPGHKPEAFCEWVIRCLGAEREDQLDDLFPGTGVMGRVWERWRSQLELEPMPPKKGPRREVRDRLLRASQPSLPSTHFKPWHDTAWSPYDD